MTSRIQNLGALATAIVAGYTAYKMHEFVGEIAAERVVEKRLKRSDEQAQTLQQEVVQARVEDGLPLDGPDDKDPQPKYLRKRAGRREKMVDALVAKTYYQFGNRPTSEANLITTRKFMRDELQQYKDLRDGDALGIIDSALYPSFLPSQYLREANQMVRTRAYHERAADVPGTWWDRNNPFATKHRVPVVRA